MSIWNNNSSSNTSGFYKAISKATTLLGPNFQLSVCNPNHINVWNDPWILDLPLNRKPIYLNMHFINNLNINSLISDGALNLHTCSSFFGGNLNRVCLNDVVFYTMVLNEWVWCPTSSNATTVAAVYNFLNSEGDVHNYWTGWNHIWKLKVSPRVKLFIWKVAHGKLPTGAYLYNLNIGPASLCHFCGLTLKLLSISFGIAVAVLFARTLSFAGWDWTTLS